MTSKSALLLVAIGIAGLLATYAYSKVHGVKISTTTDAFGLPSENQPQVVAKDGSVRNIIDGTPAPWPEEAGDIYKLARFSIPVKVVLTDSPNKTQFTVVGLNGDGNFIVESKSRRDADILMAEFGRE